MRAHGRSVLIRASTLLLSLSPSSSSFSSSSSSVLSPKMFAISQTSLIVDKY